MKGATPKTWKTRAQGATRRQKNQLSGRATITARAAERAASPREAISASLHSPSVKIAAYHSSENPRGGNSSVFFSFTETPATTARGAARKNATTAM